MSDGFDHTCDAHNHGVYNRNGWMVGEECPVLIHGKPCGGILVAVGAGSRIANAKFQMVPA